MTELPNWTKWVGFVVLLLATSTAVILWASEAHSDNRSGIIENRTRIEQDQASHARIERKIGSLEAKLDRLLFLMAGS
jgi:hypothetical protein